MSPDEKLDKLLLSFERYYTIKKENVTNPFTAEAEFRSHSEQYVLIKAAKIAEMDSNEFVYFKTIENLSNEELKNLAEIAWKSGTSNIKPYYGHRNSDVTLIILADKVEDAAAKNFRSVKYSKSYKFGFLGWSNFKLGALELSTGKFFSNRLGKDLKKTLANIKN